jgi:hypothetical protein
MADQKATPVPLVPTIDMLNQAGDRFRAHADQIVNSARLDVADDLKLAGRISTAYAKLRFGVAGEAGRTHDPASAERLRELLIEEM